MIAPQIRSTFSIKFLIQLILFIIQSDARQAPELQNHLTDYNPADPIANRRTVKSNSINKLSPILPVVSIEETGVVEEIMDQKQRKTLIKMMMNEKQLEKLQKIAQEEVSNNQNQDLITVPDSQENLPQSQKEDMDPNQESPEQKKSDQKVKQRSEVSIQNLVDHTIENSDNLTPEKNSGPDGSKNTLESNQSAGLVVVKTKMGVEIRTKKANDESDSDSDSKLIQKIIGGDSENNPKIKNAGSLEVPDRKNISRSQKKRQNRKEREKRLDQKVEALQKEYETFDSEIREQNKRKYHIKKEGKSMGHLGIFYYPNYY